MQFSNNSPPYFPRMSPTNDIIYLHDQRREFYICSCVTSLFLSTRNHLLFLSRIVLLCFQFLSFIQALLYRFNRFSFFTQCHQFDFQALIVNFCIFWFSFIGRFIVINLPVLVLKSKLQLHHVYKCKIIPKKCYVFIKKGHSHSVKHK